MQKIIALLFVVATSAFSGTIDEKCPNLTAYGAPQSPSVSQELCRTGYAVGYSYQYRDPVYSVVKLTAASVKGRLKRDDSFREDTEIPKQHRATLQDYLHGQWDRGHMTAAGDLNWSAMSMRDSFLLSNIIPQNLNLNRGAWRKIETLARNWAKTRKELYVYTGPIFYNNYQTVGAGVAVPQELFKVIYDPAKNQAIAFIMPNRDVDVKKIENYVTSIDEVERLTGIDFFPAMPYNKKSVKNQVLKFDTWIIQ